MRRIRGTIALMRPHNVAAAVLSVAVGFAMTGARDWPWLVLAATAFAAAAGNVINDIYDVEIDRVNRPKRPIPAGAASLRAAAVEYVFFVAAALFIAVFLAETARIWIFAWVILLHFYSARFKRMYLLGNAAVAAVGASGFLLGASAGGDAAMGAIPAAFTFVFIVGREIVKDTDDIEGDRAAGARTFPIVSGRRAALTAAIVVFIALCVAFPLPAYLGIYSLTYALIMLVSVVPMLAASVWIILRGRRLDLVGSLLKLGMFFGCVAFYFARMRP
jgi:geranylgeranylglycerol-phosphate geranylgeranyltransferase